MGVFSYKGIDREGREVKGVVEAPTSSAAYSLLKKQGVYPYEIVEERETARKSSPRLIPLLKRRKTVSNKELAVFLRTLSTLLSAGIPIVDAVESFANSEESKHLAVFFKKVASHLKEGKPLSTALQEAGVKSRIVLSLIKAGEKSALLPETLTTVAELLERREELKEKLIQASMYPAILLTVTVGIVVFMLTVVIPKIVIIYKEAKLSLPTSTKVVIGVSNFLRSYYPLLLILAAAAAGGVLLFSRKKRKTFDRLKLKTPVVGKIILYVELQRFTETLSKLLGSGLPLIEAIETAAETVKNAYVREELLRTTEKVKRGSSLNRSLKETELFPQVVLQLISAGERSGGLPKMAEKASNYLKGEVEFKLQNLTSLLEPATMLILGLIVGFIIYALLLPIVSISTIKAF